MSHTKSTCVISLGLTIMDRCPECEKQERAAEEAERVERNRTFAARWTREDGEERTSAVSRAETMTEYHRHMREMRESETRTCGCDKPHEPGARFFVSCIEDSGQRRNVLLLGPYDTHEEALANVERGRKLATDNDPKAHWYSFGTCSISELTDRNGVFEK